FIAGRMAGFGFTDKGGYYLADPVPLKTSEKFKHALNKMRNVYSQFGLGIQTGIDFPSEALGFSTEPANSANILHLSFGQFDTYTPIQMAQYASTIANGGYRLQLHLLQSIHKPVAEQGKIGEAVYQFKPNVLNHISMDEKHLDNVQRGFW